MKRLELGAGIRDQTPSVKGEAMSRATKQFVVCVKNDGYSASLEKRKIYLMLRDPSAEKHGQLRIIDKSGDDYLYPKNILPFDCAAAVC